MKCKECVKEGAESRLYGGDSCITTCMGTSSFYDEQGRRHFHDPNSQHNERLAIYFDGRVDCSNIRGENSLPDQNVTYSAQNQQVAMTRIGNGTTALPAFPKPGQLEGIVTLTQAQRANKRQELYHRQCGMCACGPDSKGCGRKMSRTVGEMDSAELDHITPQPAGCKKQDADFNLRCVRRDCNSKKGSQRE